MVHLQHTAIADRTVVCALRLGIAAALADTVVRAVLCFLIFLQGFHGWCALCISSRQTVIGRSGFGEYRHEVVEVDAEHEEYTCTRKDVGET
jgi:hypothetical protein